MQKFIYRMQSILDIKQKLEEQERTYYGIAKRHLTEEEEKLELLYQRKDSYEQQLREKVCKKLDLIEIRKLSDAVELMKIQIQIQIVNVSKAQQAVELARKRLEFAMIERKTQEKLKEKAFETYCLEFNAEERKEIDELVSFTYGERIKQSELVAESD